MPNKTLRRLLPVAFAVASCGVAAQGKINPALAADPLDASTVVPAVDYRSSLAGYRGVTDEKPLSWRDANDQVGKIGGWRAYAREANAPEVSPAEGKPAEADAANRPAPDAHRGHRMK